MPLAPSSIWRDFLITADNTDVLSGDTLLGSRGQGRYSVTAVATGIDATITISDGDQVILNGVPVPVKTAAATQPSVEEDRNRPWVFRYVGGDHPVINVADGTSLEVAVRVRYLGK